MANRAMEAAEVDASGWGSVEGLGFGLSSVQPSEAKRLEGSDAVDG